MVIYKQKLLKWMLFGYGGLMLLLIGLSTAARFLNSDVLFQDGLWAIALDIVTAIVDVFAFAFASAVVIYGIYAVGARNMTTVFSAFFSVTVFHYVAILGIGWAIYPGTLPETVEDWLRMALESLVLYILLDCLRLFIVGFVTAKLLAKREAARNDYNRIPNRNLGGVICKVIVWPNSMLPDSRVMPKSWGFSVISLMMSQSSSFERMSDASDRVPANVAAL